MTHDAIPADGAPNTAARPESDSPTLDALLGAIKLRDAIKPESDEIERRAAELLARKEKCAAEISELEASRSQSTAARVRSGATASASEMKEHEASLRRQAVLRDEVRVLDEMLAEAQKRAEAVAARYGIEQAKVRIAEAQHRGRLLIQCAATLRELLDQHDVVVGLIGSMQARMCSADAAIGGAVLAEIEGQRVDWIRRREDENQKELERRWSELAARIPS